MAGYGDDRGDGIDDMYMYEQFVQKDMQEEMTARVQTRLETEADELRDMLAAFTSLALTQIQYTDILQYMPDNYVKTWSRLYRYLDIDASAVLASNDAGTANRLMLDCLIQRYNVDISGFCDILERIPNIPYELSSIVESLRGVLPFAIQKKFAQIVGIDGVPIVIAVGIDLFKSIEDKISTLIDNLFNDVDKKVADIDKKIADINKKIAKIYKLIKEVYKKDYEFIGNSFQDASDENIISMIHFELETLKAYLIGFKPHDNCKFPPKIIHFTMEQGQKLISAKVTWTHNSIAVEKEINTFINGEQFVFYRNGSFSGVNMDAQEALNVIFCEICWDHHLLIVGDDSGLREELKKDIQIVAALAGLSDADLCSLHSSVQNSFGRFYGERGVFTLLIIPNSSLLKAILQECILKCANYKLTIIYSGHNEKDFGWVLADDDRFSGSDLKQVLSDVKPQHYPQINILLNCCYGFAYAKEIGDLQTFISCLEIELPNKIKEKIKIKSPNNNFANCLKYYSILPASEIDEWFEHNKCITRAMCEIAKKTSYRASQINGLPYKVSVVPFAIGPLEAHGILSQKIVENKYGEMDWSKLRNPPKNLPHKNLQRNTSDVSDPQFFVFGAGNGDSTLFRWHNFNMLVDGGIYTAPPCFWRTVCQLPKLDVIVVTHYDEDHIAGILRLFKENPLPIAIDELYSIEPLQSSEGATRSSKQGKDLWELAKIHCDRKNLVCNPTQIIITKEFSGGDRLRIFMLTPTEEKLKKAAERMKKYRGCLTIPNQASASLLIECRIKTNYKYALLTGDAPSEAIIEGLDQLKESDEEVRENCYRGDHYCFDYIDMPHHGSKQNDPGYFLSKISSKVCVVSTNGNHHNHPDVETLHELNQAMTKDNIKDLLFTYCNKRTVKKNKKIKIKKAGDRIISESFSDKNKQNLLFTDNNPRYTDSKQYLLVKLTTPVGREKEDIIG